ncbi:hypothetical protein OAO87_02675, partial [bacterium]|nr:hypothetical protein [bacterium]
MSLPCVRCVNAKRRGAAPRALLTCFVCDAVPRLPWAECFSRLAQPDERHDSGVRHHDRGGASRQRCHARVHQAGLRWAGAGLWWIIMGEGGLSRRARAAALSTRTCREMRRANLTCTRVACRRVACPR